MKTQTQFMHYRKFNMTQSNGFSEVNSRGGATVAVYPAENNTVLISVARCNPNDVFNKKVGRTIAEGRIRAYLEGREGMDKYVKVLSIPDPLFLKKTVAEALEDEIDEAGLE
jgi:hypothetical protein